MSKIKFNPLDKDELCYRECLLPIVFIKTKSNAQQYLQDYISYIQKCLNKNPAKNGETAEWIAINNIYYWTMYLDANQKENVINLFNIKNQL